jgi:hypothetical protein
MVWAAFAQAGTLQLGEVPADAKWVAHIDVDAMRASAVMQKFYDECLAGRVPSRLLDKMAQKCGMDPRRELHGLTLYGTKFVPGHGVLMLRAEMDESVLLEKAKRAPKYRTIQYRDYDLHSFMFTKRGKQRELAGAFPKAGVLVLASSPEMVKSALDVMDGQSASLQGTDSPLAVKVPRGTMFLARASGIHESQAGARYPVCAQLDRLNYAEGQHQGQWFGHLAITATDEDAAAQVEAGLTGLKAIFELSLASAPKLQQMLDQVKTRRQGKVVRCDFEAPLKEVVQAVPEMCDLLRACCPTHLAMRGKKTGGQQPDDKKQGSEKKAGEKRADEKEVEDKTSADQKKATTEKKNAPASREDDTATKQEPGTAKEAVEARGTPVLGVVIGKPWGAEAAEVMRVWGDSPAAKAGLRRGDRIVKVNGKKIESPEGLHTAILQQKPGDKIDLVVDRNGQQIETSARLAGADDFAGRGRDRRRQLPRLLSPRPWLGIQIGSGAGRGVLVAGVLPGSPADVAGLKSGDAIVRVDKTRVEAPADLQAAIAGCKPGETVRLVVNRDDSRKEIEVELGAFGIWEGESNEDARQLLKRFLEGRFPRPEQPPVEPGTP